MLKQIVKARLTNGVTVAIPGILGLLLCCAGQAFADPVFLGPSPYLGFADSPFSITNGFTYFYLETFEDGTLDTPGATVSSNWVVLPPGPFTDSVDADDGLIDGLGTNGYSFYSNHTETNLTVTFDPAALGGHWPTHAGIVCTDVGQVTFGSIGVGDIIMFEAFDTNAVSLGSISLTNFGNGTSFGDGLGATAEDRFFGVFNPDGISSFSINIDNSVDWELDHLQYGFLPSVPQLPPAALRIELLSPDTALVAWSTNAVGFALQENADLLSTTNWTIVTNVPEISGAEYQVTVSPLETNRFYRLISP